MKYFKPYMPAISIFCLALFIRIIYNITVANGYVPTFDAGVYNILARSIVETHCYCRAVHQPTTFRPPLWPFIIATIYFFQGEHSAYARLFYCLLDSGTCVFVYLLAKDLFGKRIALVTGVIAALYVGLFVWTGWLYTETLYTFCLTALIFSLSRLQQSMLPTESKMGKKSNITLSQLRWIVLAGFFLGLSLLTRPTGSILVGLICLWVTLLIFISKIVPWKALIKNTLAVLLIALIVNIPWLYRDYLITHTIFPISTIGTTLIGNYDDAVFQGNGVIRGMWLPPHNTINPDFHDYTLADEQNDTADAFKWMSTHVDEVPTLLFLHAVNMWTPYLYAHGLPFEQFPNRLSSRIMYYLIPITSLPIFLLAVIGFLVTWKHRKKQFLLIYLTIAMTILQNIAFYGSPRYRAPIEPLLVLLVGGMLWWLTGNEVGTWKHFRSKKELVQKELSSQPLFEHNIANTSRGR